MLHQKRNPGDSFTILERLKEILPNQTNLMPHLEWILGNLHIETIQAVHGLCHVLELRELEQLLLAMEANRTKHARNNPRRVFLTDAEKRVLRATMSGIRSKKIAGVLGITMGALYKVRERMNRKFGQREGDRIRGGSAAVLAMAHYPFTFIAGRLTAKQRLLLRCLAEGLDAHRTAAVLDIPMERLPAMKNNLDERLGLPYFCDFMTSAPANSLRKGGHNAKT